MSVNKAILVGNIGKDPEIRTAENVDRIIVRFTLATSERYRSKGGEVKEETVWHNIVYFTKPDSKLPGYLRKGICVFVEGSISNRQYTDQQGVSRFVSEIKATTVQLLSQNPQTSASTQQGPYQSNGMPTGYQQGFQQGFQPSFQQPYQQQSQQPPQAAYQQYPAAPQPEAPAAPQPGAPEDLPF